MTKKQRSTRGVALFCFNLPVGGAVGDADDNFAAKKKLKRIFALMSMYSIMIVL